eukprot:CAMPEP_0176456350 /NCGR_PEP_ID=MMETSP0127-20121128/31233_1 /TAXON_ID=938130 /ORGANISM="Platyophrya macrostoma, Strain WH" /LENGTH=209 /DNA_ID=CAMNT_0017846287 /DNA_START=422 /DNA_END=1051 /DNA_ORIENTATION=-
MAYDSTKEKPEDRRMPLLREVFEQFPHVLINIELKHPTEELLIRTNALVKEFKRENTLIWGCRQRKDTQILQKLNPEVPCFFTAESVYKVYLSYFFGLLPFVSLPEHSIQLPYFMKEYQEELKTAKLGRKIYLYIVKLFSMVSVPIAKHLEKRGVLFAYWVLNNHEDFRKTYEGGAHAIMTDAPTELIKFLKKEGLYMDPAPYIKDPLN